MDWFGCGNGGVIYSPYRHYNFFAVELGCGAGRALDKLCEGQICDC
jgi:hypothetical protein